MEKLNIHEEVRANKRRTYVLIFSFILFIAALGYVLGFILATPILGLIIALIGALFYTVIMYMNGSNLVLKTTGAKEATKKEHPHLFHTVEGLALAAGIPTPKCYVIEDTALNAFATGTKPENASITVTTGLLKKLNRQELEGVIAHEMSHIKNYDIRIMLITVVLIGVTILLSDLIIRSYLWGGHGNKNRDTNQLTIILIITAFILAILAPIIAELIKLAVSRRREYLADANGAVLCRNPEALASALERIKEDPDPLVDKANKATAHLFISSPFRKTKGLVTKLFSTHPDIDDRIRRLRAM
ncbi:MAG: zinc metalloprotease HtpX [bacterium]|nr:zinc metalloprotease HtpX [bacterium]